MVRNSIKGLPVIEINNINSVTFIETLESNVQKLSTDSLGMNGLLWIHVEFLMFCNSIIGV